LPILSALLKPKTRSIEPSFEHNLDKDRGLLSPSFKRFLSLFPCVPRYILSTKFYFSDERVYVSFPSYVYRGFRRPLTIIIS